MVNHYHVLGLNEDASPQEIKAAFKRLAVLYHPDKHPDRPEMEEKFKEVNAAHQILSDPYEKARFDLKLKYQQFAQTQAPSRPYTYQRPQYRYRPGPGPYSGGVDYRKNAIATAYAFGITFGIALLVMMGVWAKRSYDAAQLEKELIARRATFEKAKEEFSEGNYQVAFETMATITYFRSEERDMRHFKATMIDEIVKKGNEAFRQEKYSSAISLYEIALEFEPQNSFYEVKKKLIDAYRYNGEPYKAIDLLDEFIIKRIEMIGSLVKAAEITRDQLNNPQAALEHYITAHRLAIKKYKNMFGEGYPLVIQERYVPRSHYYLYTGLAETYLILEDTEMALKASDWNKYIWPDSTQAYLTSANAFIKENKQEKACIEFRGAKERGWVGEPKINCN